MLKRCIVILFLLLSFTGKSQSTQRLADSIRKAYRIPELAYAVVSSSTIYELKALGVRRINTKLAARIDDRFRIGSNTKAITGFIAARLVAGGKIKWDTKFFDLFPEWKVESNAAYHNVSLLQLLSFRTRLYSYTYTYDEPRKEQFSGGDDSQRYQFAKWFMKHEPVSDNDSIHFSNLGYVAAGLMLEKVSGKSYRQLVTELGEQLEIQFGFGPPNLADTLQPWGHDAHLKPERPFDNYKLNWLQAAGNINVSLPDYIKFIQLQLKGLHGQSDMLDKESFRFLHYGLKPFAMGWFWDTDEQGSVFSYNTGNPGSFLTKVFVFADKDIAFVIFSNAQTEAAENGIDMLYEALKQQYLH